MKEKNKTGLNFYQVSKINFTIFASFY